MEAAQVLGAEDSYLPTMLFKLYNYIINQQNLYIKPIAIFFSPISFSAPDFCHPTWSQLGNQCDIDLPTCPMLISPIQNVS
jgi:hypothetical protein